MGPIGLDNGFVPIIDLSFASYAVQIVSNDLPAK